MLNMNLSILQLANAIGVFYPTLARLFFIEAFACGAIKEVKTK